MSEFYWRARFVFYRMSGIARRLLLLVPWGCLTVGEVMSRLECNPELRARLDAARVATGITRRHW